MISLVYSEKLIRLKKQFVTVTSDLMSFVPKLAHVIYCFLFVLSTGSDLNSVRSVKEINGTDFLNLSQTSDAFLVGFYIKFCKSCESVQTRVNSKSSQITAK